MAYLLEHMTGEVSDRTKFCTREFVVSLAQIVERGQPAISYQGRYRDILDTALVFDRHFRNMSL